ncbi:TonB-dependent receptor [Ornithobacterium rhinotracheale]|uniref:TonB-dependent receptor n=1 Tax=Ornithobacterium rhinotracheale TaxID=28251 RepID=UPI003FD23573
MKNKLHLTTYLLLIFSFLSAQKLEVKIYDQINFQQIFDAKLIINNQIITPDHGVYSYSPAQKLSVKIEKNGYETYEDTFSQKLPEKLYIMPLAQKLEIVIAQGRNQNLEITQASSDIHEDKILKNSGKDLGKILENVAGVSMLQTGGTISKPIINGLQGTRVVIMNNGSRLESQQWGADHAPEIDPGMAKKITIIKGADAVKYGADALGGIILLSAGDLPYHGGFSGNLTSGYESNGRKYSVSGKAEGSLKSYPHFAWRVQGAAKNSGDLKTADYYLNNTGSREYDFSATLGLDYNTYGVEAFYSRFNTDLGIFYAAHAGNLDDFYGAYSLGKPAITYDFNREIEAPKQAVSHDLAKIKTYFKSEKLGQFDLQYAFQFNHRQEYSRRRGTRTRIPAVDMELKTHAIDFGWHKEYANYWKSALGANYIYQENYNNPSTQAVPLIPNFASEIFGIYAIQKYAQRKWSAEMGARYDYKDMDSKGYDLYGNFYGGRRNFGNFTYSFGLAYQPTHSFYIKSNVGMAWRAPQVNELYSNGLHHGAGNFEVGDKNLNSERGLKWVNSVHFHTKKFSIETDFYWQNIKNYIFNVPTQETKTLFSGIYPIYKYQQTDAVFTGIDADFSYKIIPQLDYRATAAFIWAKNKTTDTYLPNIPPTNISQELVWHKDFEKTLKSLSFGIQHRFTAKQNRYTAANEMPFDAYYVNKLVEITPPAYHLFQASANADFKIRDNNFQVYLVADNLFNKLYKDYNNRFRFFAHDMGRNIQARIVYKF